MLGAINIIYKNIVNKDIDTNLDLKNQKCEIYNVEKKQR